jgi:hypothetical protein
VESEPESPAADDERRIVELFAHRQPLYDAATVRRLTRTPPEQLEVALDEGHVEPVIDGGRLRYEWEDVANLALQRWTPREIARTLERAGHAHALPLLNQFRSITIELPVYQIRLLHQLAEEKSEEVGALRSVSDILEYELAALATENMAALEKRFAGFVVAALFPKLSRAYHVIEARCLYCGGRVADGAEICPACTRRHVPAR